MPFDADIARLGGGWLHPIQVLSAVSLFWVLRRMVRTYGVPRVSPLAWILLPAATYALALAARLEGHAALSVALTDVPPDQVESLALAGLAVALAPEALAASLLAPVLVIGSVCAGLVGWRLKHSAVEPKAPMDPRRALGLVALAQLALAAVLWWRGARVAAQSRLYDAFHKGAPDQLRDIVSEGFVQYAAANQGMLIAVVGLLVAPVLLYAASIAVPQGRRVWAAPALILALFAGAVTVQNHGGSVTLNELSMGVALDFAEDAQVAKPEP